jgi:hypothetical protein
MLERSAERSPGKKVEIRRENILSTSFDFLPEKEEILFSPAILKKNLCKGHSIIHLQLAKKLGFKCSEFSLKASGSYV